jgi:YVTN family beta-propeller protein
MDMRALSALSLAVLFAAAPASAAPAPLAEVQVIPLPHVARRIDHFAVDPAGKRLFVAALGNGSLEVLDVGAGKRITSVGGLKEPQGVAYLARQHRVVVAMRGGSVAAFDDASWQRTATIPNLGDSDNLRWDAAAGELLLGYGAGALGLIDPSSMTIVANIQLGAHPESFRAEERGARVFVNLPDLREIAVADRKARSIVARLPLPGFDDNYPMYLDEPGHRLFVGVRRPAELLVIDTTTLKRIADVPCVGDTDDLFYDARRARVYVIGGGGFVDVFDGSVSGAFAKLARIPTRAGARTGLFSPELDRLFVAWPAQGGKDAEIHAYAPP